MWQALGHPTRANQPTLHPAYPRPTAWGPPLAPCGRRWGIPPGQTSLPYTQLTLHHPPGGHTWPPVAGAGAPPRSNPAYPRLLPYTQLTLYLDHFHDDYSGYSGLSEAPRPVASSRVAAACREPSGGGVGALVGELAQPTHPFENLHRLSCTNQAVSQAETEPAVTGLPWSYPAPTPGLP